MCEDANAESKCLDMIIKNQATGFAICSLLEKDIMAEEINQIDCEVESKMENEGDLILQSLQKVCGRLRETKNYNQEMIPIIEKIVDIADKIYMLTDHEPPTIQKS